MFDNSQNTVPKILIVDDTPKNLQVLGNLLQNNEYEVEFATNGKAALNWIEEDNFDLILLDIMMPEMDGYEVCEKLKSNNNTKNIPIIFLTAKIDTESIVKGFKLGAADYVTKPFNKEELLARISTQLTLIQSKKELMQKNQMVSDSIAYAEKIQQALLPTKEFIDCVLPDSFIFFKPRDIVSGDFYWIKKIKNILYFAAADCTGHGIPGAFMSMLGISTLNDIIGTSRLDMPSEILNKLRKKIKLLLNQTGKEYEQKDGMDIALCMLDTESKCLYYAGAFNPLYLIRNNEFIEYKANRQPIAIHEIETDFTNHEIQLKKDDIIYIFSDGFPDQTGGENNKKFKTKYFKEYLLSIHNQPIKKQKQLIEDKFVVWKGNNEQVDDIIIIGVKIK